MPWYDYFLKKKGAGEFYATSSFGAVTGEGCGSKDDEKFSGCLLIDDPVKADDHQYENKLAKVIDNAENTLSTRRNDPKITPTVLIMQRVHENDLSGHFLSGKSVFGDFDSLRLPAIADEDKDPLDPRQIGEPLWERHQDSEILENIKKKNPVLFAGQFGQRPAPAEGYIIKRKHLMRYKYYQDSYDFDVVSCDLNYVENGVSNACFSHYGVIMPNVYLINQSVGKWSFEDAYAVLVRMLSTIDYSGVIIEQQANGEAIANLLISKGHHGVVKVKPHKSKVARVSEVLLCYQAGNVWYPTAEIAKFDVDMHIHEILTFPNSTNDDRVDCEAMILKHCQDTLGHTGFLNI